MKNVVIRVTVVEDSGITYTYEEIIPYELLAKTNEPDTIQPFKGTVYDIFELEGQHFLFGWWEATIDSDFTPSYGIVNREADEIKIEVQIFDGMPKYKPLNKGK